MNNRLSLIGAVFTVLSLMAATYALKQSVKEKVAEAASIRSEIAEAREAIHVLRAEVTLLSDPLRLESLALRHLALGPAKANQFSSLEDIPIRVAVDPDGQNMQAPVASAGYIPRPHAKPYFPSTRDFDRALARLDRKTRADARAQAGLAERRKPHSRKVVVVQPQPEAPLPVVTASFPVSHAMAGGGQ